MSNLENNIFVTFFKQATSINLVAVFCNKNNTYKVNKRTSRKDTIVNEVQIILTIQELLSCHVYDLSSFQIYEFSTAYFPHKTSLHL